MTPDIPAILDRVASGGRMTKEEGLFLYTHAETDALARTARAVRDRHSDASTVTYLVDRNVNYSNVCITDCKFCEFYRPPGHEEAYILDRGVLGEKLAELVALGGSRVLLQGGHHPDLPLSWYEDLLRWIRDDFPTLEIDAFSPPEVEHISLVAKLPFIDVLRRLKEAGLGGVPGGGGEILDDEIRSQVSPKKTRTAAWLEIMGLAQSLGLYTSASQVIGFGEEPRHRLNALEAVRHHQDEALREHGLGFMAFVSWPLLFESRYGEVFGRIKGKKLGADADEYLRHTAFCRCYLDNIPHFQASWPTMGLETAGLSLQYGCDDMGGTMMEENVVSQAGSMNCSAAESDMRKVIQSAGFEPRKRDSWYTHLETSS